ncbi:hypothetical protein GT347_15960 [Xylophilus rhododendri]|uniref:Uncharacterized protein n=1 Tax=Xylophilus rhododendri TaxID=2697032 RepID=A0A857J8G4_9BURK|nr:hypothetical protein [Xylophilus rhododendri]QHI99339.1 hypothetical protein GT347_15960 [Xylophilus rhododendri]
MQSKAHAVQTSAHASAPAELDMFGDVDPLQAREDIHVVDALTFTGVLTQDAHFRMSARTAGEEPVPVVVYELQCQLGAVTFGVHGEEPYPRARRMAAEARANHCRKGTHLTLDAKHLEVRIVMPHVVKVTVLQAQPQ